MKIFLHDDVAASGKIAILVADQYGVDRCSAPGILRPVDESYEIAVVEVTEAVHFVHRRNGISDTRHNLRCQLETQIHALGADVKKKIAGRGDGMARAGLYFPKRMQFRRARLAKEPVPRLRSNSHHAGEVALNIAEADGA